MQKTQNVVGPATKGEAVLSQCLTQQTHQLLTGPRDAFDQAHDHPHVGQQRRVRHTRLVQYHPAQLQFRLLLAFLACSLVSGDRLRSRIRLRWGGRGRRPAAATAIETFFLLFPNRTAVVGRAAVARTLPAMVLSATERTTQVEATRAARMRQKANPAVRAADGATPQFGMGLQNRVQSGLILTDKRVGAIVLMPVIAKRENFPDRYDKKARLSLTMRSVLHTPSSYLPDAKASRGRARLFYGPPPKAPSIPRRNRCNTQLSRRRRRLPRRVSFSSPKPKGGYLKERTPMLLSR